MRFAWKVFLSAVLVISGAFALGGSILITSSFSASLSRETDRALEENLLMKLAYESALSAYVREDARLSEEAAAIIAEQLSDGGRRSLILTGENGKVLYSNGGERPNGELLRSAKNGAPYVVTKTNRDYTIYVACSTKGGGRTVYIQTARNITGIFDQREQDFHTYRILSFALLAVCAVVMFGVSMVLTRPLRKLSLTTRRIAQGSYHERAKVSGGDEIGDFTRDFNHMTDVLEDKIYALQNAARQREDFVASFAHELKTPLTSIIGYADMLRSMQMSPEDAFISANYIFAEGQRLESLSLKLLELMVLNRSGFQTRRVNPKVLIEQIAGLMRPVTEEHGITLKASAQNSVVLIEPDLFKTLLINLLDNARKASESGSVIELSGKNDGPYYIFSIKDHGAGIPEDEIKKITEAFYMVDKSRSRAQNGAGLGLALADKIAQLHGSRLIFESAVGKGTSVFLHIRRTQRRRIAHEDDF